MPYKDPEHGRLTANKRKRKYRSRLHEQRFGPNAGDMRGRTGVKVSGSRHHRWNSGRMLDKQGYVKVRVGKNHPLADSNGYAHEHLLVWVASGKSIPGPSELLHHKDSDRTHNRIENLELLTRGKHNSIHNAMRERDEKGRFKAASRLLDGREWNEMPEMRR